MTSWCPIQKQTILTNNVVIIIMDRPHHMALDNIICEFPFEIVIYKRDDKTMF